jgi:hypothetical protein
VGYPGTSLVKELLSCGRHVLSCFVTLAAGSSFLAVRAVHPWISTSSDVGRETFEMARKYGIAREDGAEPGEDIEGGEASSLLGPNAVTKVDGHAGGHASIVSSVSNLSNTIIGSGTCSLRLLYRTFEFLHLRNADIPVGWFFVSSYLR